MNAPSPPPRREPLAVRVGGWSARHRLAAIGLWLLLVVVAMFLGGQAGQVTPTNSQQMTGGSAQAQRMLDSAHINDPDNELVLVHSASAGGYRAALPAIAADIRASGQVAAMLPTAFSADRHDALVSFTMTGDPTTADKRVQPVLDAVARAQSEHKDLTIAEFGPATVNKWFADETGSNFHRAEWTAVPLALGILLIAFGALLAAFLPVALALTAFLAANGLLALISHAMHMDGTTNSLMLLIGLAVGVDYCLFYLRREREERAAGRDRAAALRIAAATSGRSILISGFTVMIAMAGMFLSGMLLFEGFAVATILVVAIAVTGSVTVLPALLSLFGDKVDFPRFGRRRRVAKHRFWSAAMRIVLARPGVSAVLATVALLTLAAPALGMHTQKLNFDQEAPAGAALVATEHRIDAAFPGNTDTVDVVVKAADIHAPRVQRAIAGFESAARKVPGVGAPITATVHGSAGVEEISVPLSGNGFNAASFRALATLRDTTVPKNLGPVAETGVTGDLAASVDWNTTLRDAIVPVFIFVLAFTFLLMLLAFRSVAIAATAIVLNLLSIGAAYGVMVAIFQHGIGAGLIGTRPVGAIESWIPLLVFVVLFSLSMDYHVFVVSRIKEAREAGLSTRDAVASGIRNSAGAVTSAAVIMVAVFGVFGSLSMQDYKQLGVGLATAILIDATIIRVVLLPAVMAVLGERNWSRNTRRPRHVAASGTLIHAAVPVHAASGPVANTQTGPDDPATAEARRPT